MHTISSFSFISYSYSFYYYYYLIYIKSLIHTHTLIQENLNKNRECKKHEESTKEKTFILPQYKEGRTSS